MLSLIALLYTLMSTYNKYLFERCISEVKLEDRNWLYSNLKNYFLDITFPKVRKDLSTIAAFLFNMLKEFPVHMDKFSRTNCSIMAPTVYENKTIKLTKACSNSSIDASVKYKLNPSTHPGTLITMRFVIQNGKAQGMMKSLKEGTVFSWTSICICQAQIYIIKNVECKFYCLPNVISMVLSACSFHWIKLGHGWPALQNWTFPIAMDTNSLKKKKKICPKETCDWLFPRLA